MEPIPMIHKTAALGNRWLAASLQHTHSYNVSHAEFIGKTSNHPGDLDTYRPDLVACNIWLVSKLKLPSKGKRFQTIDEIQENMTVQLMAIGRTVWGPKVPNLKGTEVSLSYVQCFLCLVSSLISVSLFHATWLDTFWTDLIIGRFINFISSRMAVFLIFILQWHTALTGLLVCLEWNPIHQKVVSLIPSHGTHLDGGFDAQLGRISEATHWCFSFTLIFLTLSPFLSL